MHRENDSCITQSEHSDTYASFRDNRPSTLTKRQSRCPVRLLSAELTQQRLTILIAINSNRTIRGYELGEIPAKGAVTVEITAAGTGVPLQAFIDRQYEDSRTMDKRPGMYLKYLPYRYDEVTGQLLTGGSYLFDSFENAKDYARWTTEDFRVGDPETPFWEQPMFESTTRIVWKVIGGHNFAPMEDHAVGRLQRWKAHGTAGIEKALRDVYPSVRRDAEAQGAAAVWMLYCPEQHLVSLQLAFKKADKGDDTASVKESLDTVARKSTLEQLLPASLAVRPVFDRSSVFLTLWLPRSRAAGGTSRTIPYYPAVPAITDEQP